MRMLVNAKCSQCAAVYNDVFMEHGILELDKCTICHAGNLHRILSAPRPVGALPSKPIPGIGCTSNSEYRQWKRDNPTLDVVSTTDNYYRNHYDASHDAADKYARKAGYRDRHDRSDKVRAETKKRQELEGS